MAMEFQLYGSTQKLHGHNSDYDTAVVDAYNTYSKRRRLAGHLRDSVDGVRGQNASDVRATECPPGPRCVCGLIGWVLVALLQWHSGADGSIPFSSTQLLLLLRARQRARNERVLSRATASPSAAVIS